MANRRLLTPEQVREVRAWDALRKALPTQKELARKFGVVPGSLRLVIHGRTHKDVR